MILTTVQIRWIHSLIFLFLMVCLGYAIYSAISGVITFWTWAALLIVFIEGLVLLYFDWQCPLTVLAERQGADSGSVADLFLPKFFADHLFQISGAAYVITVLLVLFRWFSGD